MLVDDSAVIRGALTQLLADDPAIEVISSVSNGEMAVSAMSRHSPDIIILDVEMPVMDGLTALPKLLAAKPDTKIIMFSALTTKGGEITIKAMALGAVECLVKPKSGEASKESPFHKNLLSLLHNLCPHSGAEKNIPTPPQIPKSPAKEIGAKPQAKPESAYSLHKAIGTYTGKPRLLAIGSSTGGPQALFEVIRHFKGFDIPIILTQHMPATFTKILADHITTQTGVTAVEGEDGMRLENGRVHVAPGSHHMVLKEDTGDIRIQLDDGPMENFCKPSVEPMLRSAIDIFDKKVLTVILTGMGNDGVNASRSLVGKGGRVIAQDEETSVVWGMPGAVAKAGLCQEVLPLGKIGPWVKQVVTGT